MRKSDNYTVKAKMGEVTSSFNDLVDAQGEEAEDIEIADLEDRSKRNNLKIRGIPESIQQSALKECFTQLVSAFLPDKLPGELIIDCIHWLPKPPYLSDAIPRDTIVQINFFHIKENVMLATRNHTDYSQPYTNLAFYADLSKYTMLQHKNFSTITNPSETTRFNTNGVTQLN